MPGRVTIGRSIAFIVGVILIPSGALALYNLQGASPASIVQVFPQLAIVIGTGLLYASLSGPQKFLRATSLVSAVGAGLVLVSSGYSIFVGVTASGELAPAFVSLGVFGIAITLFLEWLSWGLEQERRRNADNESI